MSLRAGTFAVLEPSLHLLEYLEAYESFVLVQKNPIAVLRARTHPVIVARRFSGAGAARPTPAGSRPTANPSLHRTRWKD